MTTSEELREIVKWRGWRGSPDVPFDVLSKAAAELEALRKENTALREAVERIESMASGVTTAARGHQICHFAAEVLAAQPEEVKP